jgi:hypothetical protein
MKLQASRLCYKSSVLRKRNPFFNPLLSNSLNSLSSAFKGNHPGHVSPSSLPPVPQNLSPSLAVFGISPVTQIESFPLDPASPKKPGFLF